jgi:hypothetical protein
MHFKYGVFGGYEHSILRMEAEIQHRLDQACHWTRS